MSRDKLNDATLESYLRGAHGPVMRRVAIDQVMQECTRSEKPPKATDDERVLRRLVRVSARKQALYGVEAWRDDRWYMYVNIASELGLSDEDILEEWRRGASRAEHLRQIMGG